MTPDPALAGLDQEMVAYVLDAISWMWSGYELIPNEYGRQRTDPKVHHCCCVLLDEGYLIPGTSRDPQGAEKAAELGLLPWRPIQGLTDKGRAYLDELRKAPGGSC